VGEWGERSKSRQQGKLRSSATFYRGQKQYTGITNTQTVTSPVSFQRPLPDSSCPPPSSAPAALHQARRATSEAEAARTDAAVARADATAARADATAAREAAAVPVEAARPTARAPSGTGTPTDVWSPPLPIPGLRGVRGMERGGGGGKGRGEKEQRKGATDR